MLQLWCQLVQAWSQEACNIDPCCEPWKQHRALLQVGYPCSSLHGGKDQLDRESTIKDFKTNVCNVLVATSVAARGLDVKDLKLVVNYNVPNHHEDYVHRVGRTGEQCWLVIQMQTACHLLLESKHANCKVWQQSSLQNVYQTGYNWQLLDIALAQQ